MVLYDDASRKVIKTVAFIICVCITKVTIDYFLFIAWHPQTIKAFLK